MIERMHEGVKKTKPKIIEGMSKYPEELEHRLNDLNEQLGKMKKDGIIDPTVKIEHDTERIKKLRELFLIIFKEKGKNK